MKNFFKNKYYRSLFGTLTIFIYPILGLILGIYGGGKFGKFIDEKSQRFHIWLRIIFGIGGAGLGYLTSIIMYLGLENWIKNNKDSI